MSSSKTTVTEERNNAEYQREYDRGRAPEDPATYIVDSFFSSGSPGFQQGRRDKEEFGPKSRKSS